MKRFLIAKTGNWWEMSLCDRNFGVRGSSVFMDRADIVIRVEVPMFGKPRITPWKDRFAWYLAKPAKPPKKVKK